MAAATQLQFCTSSVVNQYYFELGTRNYIVSQKTVKMLEEKSDCNRRAPAPGRSVADSLGRIAQWELRCGMLLHYTTITKGA